MAWCDAASAASALSGRRNKLQLFAATNVII